MITEMQGDLLTSDVDALVNAVNTVGVMGKGIALQFRRAFPEMFDAYAKACRDGEVQVGQMHVWETGTAAGTSTSTVAGPRFIVNFPTKQHWRAPSQLAWIEDGLTDLVRVIEENKIRSIAVPALGAGNGGLDWAQVRPKIEDALAEIDGLEVQLFVPHPPATADGAAPGKRQR